MIFWIASIYFVSCVLSMFSYFYYNRLFFNRAVKDGLMDRDSIPPFWVMTLHELTGFLCIVLCPVYNIYWAVRKPFQHIKDYNQFQKDVEEFDNVTI